MRADHARAGHAEGVADRNGTAVHVELLRIDAQTVAAVDHLDSESFVEFPEIDVFDLEALALQQFRNGKDRADAHFIGFAAGDWNPRKMSL